MDSVTTSPRRPPLRRAVGTPIAGVCQGVAQHLGLAVPLVRVVFVLLALAGGMGLILYLWLWIFVPDEREPAPHAGHRGLSGPAVEGAQTAQAEADPDGGEPSTPGLAPLQQRIRQAADALTSSPEVLIGGVFLGVSGLLLAQLLGVNLDWRLILIPAALLAGTALVWSQVDAVSMESRGAGAGAVWQVTAGVVLVLAALLMIAAGLTGTGELLAGTVGAVMLLSGVALVVAPWLIRLYRTSQVERARAAAEAERADIAAHLHDSVLQTLALIQKQKADPAQVERLARAQERQLRAYLYRQDATPPGTLQDQILAVAADLEETYAVPVEVVCVGASRRNWHQPLVAASREAILNALRHAGPPSVYIESTADADAVFIRDRGAGFEAEAIPQDRLGVRESIIGRMERAGGEARIRSSSGGTEVQLSMPVTAADAASAASPASGAVKENPVSETSPHPEGAP